jgi:tRNA modification GTPase
MQGELGARYAGWTRRLIDIVASCETAIDFIDEPDGAMAATGVLEQASCLRREIAAHLDDGRRGERVREGLVFAIVGAPNVGKSSLLNALAASDVAIVSDRPGTTRDVVEARLSFAGVLVTLLDTAGLRESDDPLEAEGMRRARARAEEADLVIEVRDATAPDAAAADVVASNRMMVFNKVDMAPLCHSGCLGVSAVTGAGLPQLRNRLTAEASALAACGGDAPLTRARHRAALTTVADHLDGLMDAAWPELQAEEARLALRAQARITGAIGVEDVLDAIFRQFCIGK